MVARLATLTQAVCAAVLALPASACIAWHQHPLPAPQSAPPARAAGTLRAGFGRADITPPPGVGLGGNGPEGRTSTGWRHRLYARALVLEDPAGERVAFVVADLPMLSPNLHRLAAERITPETGIGADRLVISATHTHSGPGHHYGERQYNQNATRLPGYDPYLADFLVTRIAEAVLRAWRDLAPARAAWGFQDLRGFTRNRSYGAYCRNPAERRTACPDPIPSRIPDSLLTRAVDTRWAMLRVDQDAGGGSYRPVGAFSVFAIHGTATPSVTTLLDGDIHAVVERRLEQRIDEELNGLPAGFTPRALHLFANGTEGDVSPNRDPETTQCPVPSLVAPRSEGPRTAASPWEWVDADEATLRRCSAAARRFIDSAGRIMGDSAFAHFRRLGQRLSSDIRIARAFTTVRLPGHAGLCARGTVGTSTAAGASDVPTRVAGWKLLGLFSLGFEQGGSAIKHPPKGCQGAKQVLLGAAQPMLIAGEHGMPEVAQLSLVRVGGVLLGAIPAEATTTTGLLLREAILRGADPGRTRGDSAVIVGLANGFIQYVTTEHEYREQTYEGGSALYGPRTAQVLGAEVEALARDLAAAAPASPSATVTPLTAYPGEPLEIMPRGTATPALSGPPRLLSAACGRDGALRLGWLDEPPGRLVPADGQLLAIEERRGAGWAPFAWDDMSDVVVEAVRPRGRAGYEWRVTLSRATGEKTLRLRVLARERGLARGFTSGPIPGCPGPGAGSTPDSGRG